MRPRDAIISAIVAALFPASAFANECNIDQSKDHQVVSTKITVQNKSSDKLRAKLKVAGIGSLRVLGKNKSQTKTFEVPKDSSESSNLEKVHKNNGVDLEVWDENLSGDIKQKILTTRFKVINAHSPDEEDTPKNSSTFDTTTAKKQKKFNSYDVTCSVKFDGTGKNAWHYKIVVKDN